MSRRRLLLVPVFAALLVVSAQLRVNGQIALTPPGGDIVSTFSAYLEALRSQAGIPGMAVAIVGPEGILWERGYGHQSLERQIPARPDTPFHVDGLTELLTSTLVLRCVEAGRLSLNDRLSLYAPGALDADLTIRQALSHTTGTGESAVFQYRPDRLEPLLSALEFCRAVTPRETFARLLDGLSMMDSVPGPDAVFLPTQEDAFPTAPTLLRYGTVLTRIASPYAVDGKRRATLSQYSTTTLTPTSGVVSTVRDLAQFDRALRAGLLLDPLTLLEAWTAPLGPGAKRLPRGLGWFVQAHNGETIVWHFGVSDNASSSLIISVPGRGLSLIVLANSSGLVRPFPLASGDVMASPFARLFLGYFVR